MTQRSIDVVHEGAQLEFERAVAESEQQRRAPADLEHPRMLVGAGEQDVAHLIGVAVIADADLDDDAAGGVGMRPVLHRRR